MSRKDMWWAFILAMAFFLLIMSAIGVLFIKLLFRDI